MTGDIVYVVVMQPDGDWDHKADILGVFSELKDARRTARAIRDREAQIIKCEVGTPVKVGEMKVVA